MTLEPSFYYYVLAALQAVGLVSTWLARRSVGSRRQAIFQTLFLAVLASLGLSTIYTVLINGTWLASGTTLALMVVTGTCEFRTPSTVPQST